MIASIADPSQVSAARRAAADFARASGFDETATGRIALVATEMATAAIVDRVARDLASGGDDLGLVDEIKASANRMRADFAPHAHDILDAYPGLAVSHPSLIAGVLFRDHRRGRDDASIVVMRAAP